MSRVEGVGRCRSAWVLLDVCGYLEVQAFALAPVSVGKVLQPLTLNPNALGGGVGWDVVGSKTLCKGT